MTLTCAKCGTPIERQLGAGRPPTYCGDLCKRLIEYEIRRVDRRLAAYELEERELKAAPADWPDDEEQRRTRLRVVRRWIRIDEDRLRELVGAGKTTCTRKDVTQ